MSVTQAMRSVQEPAAEAAKVAARVPLLRADVRGFARKLRDLDVAEVAREAMARLDGHALQVVLTAATATENPPSSSLITEAFPMLPSAELGLSLLGQCPDDPLAAILELIERDCLSNERHSLMLFAATLALEDRDPPPTLERRIRLHARRSLSVEAGSILGFAALQSGARDVQAVVGPWVGAVRTPAGRRLLGKLRELVSTPALELLPQRSAEALPRPHVREEHEKVGRNDPCPCGSGKKFKKCCALKSLNAEEARLLARQVSAKTRKPARTLPALHGPTSEAAIAQLGPNEIARLPKARLGTQHLILALRKLIGFRRWNDAEFCLAELEKRADAEEPVENYRWELLHEALVAQRPDLCRRLARGHTEKLPSYLALGMELLTPGPGTCEMVEKHALEGLRDPSQGGLFDLAYALLDHLPALGVLVARGALDAGMPLDSATLLDTVELARDRLLLPPGDHAQTLYELLAHDAAEERAGEEAARMRREARRIRQEVDEARRRLQEMESRTQALEEDSRDRDADGDADRDQELGRLRRKVSDLKSLVQDGNRQRRQLREKLAALRSEPEAAPGLAARASSPDDGEEWRGAENARRPVRLPRWGPRFEASLSSASPRLAARAMALVGALSAEEEGAWAQTKQLRTGDLYSSRIGLHHRLLFRNGQGEGYEFLELVPREGFETALKRYS